MLSVHKNFEAKVKSSFVLTGIETVITLPAVYLSVLGIDCRRANSACQTVAMREHFMHRGGGDVEGRTFPCPLGRREASKL